MLAEFVRTTVGRVVCGQLLAFIMACTGVFTTLLVNGNASFPLLQSITAYAAIVLVFVPLYAPFYLDRGWRRLLDVCSLAESDVLLSSPPVPHSSRQSPPAPVDGRCGGDAAAPLRFSNFVVGDRLWRYLIIAVADLEANYLVVRAYQYTNMTSVQLLDCFTIPCVMILSLTVLKVVYSKWQILGAAVAVCGMAVLILLDADGLTRTTEAPNVVLGDVLCLASSVCYAISNVTCEKLIKAPAVAAAAAAGSYTTTADGNEGGGNSSSAPYLRSAESLKEVPPPGSAGTSNLNATNAAAAAASSTSSGPMTRAGSSSPLSPAAVDNTPTFGGGGGGYSGVASRPSPAAAPVWLPVLEYLAVMPSMALCLGVGQFFILEYADLAAFAPQWAWHDTIYLLAFDVCMIVVYVGMPVLFCISSATFANLSLLSSDVYSIVFNVTVFAAYPKPSFFLPYVVIVAGIAAYDTNGFQRLREKYRLLVDYDMVA